MFGFEFKADSGLFSHSFRTVVIDASNRVQQIYPVTGNLSEALVQDMVKAANPTQHSNN